ncbi:MAG: hypothetical protein ABJO36_03005 [Litorimonas sp.]
MKDCGGALGLLAALLLGTISTSAMAQDEPTSITPRFSGDLRLRYQALEEDNFTQAGEALTLRFAGAVELDIFKKTSVLAEVEGVAALINNYNDGTGDNAVLPVIPDPDGIELNRLQIISEIIPKTRVTVGRQRLALDDWRFIGAFPFRQNNQSIEAIRVETTAFGPGILDIGYFNKVRRPLGADNAAGVFEGDSFFANYNLATPLGRASAFHYATELETGAKGLDLQIASTQTTGVRILGRRDWQNFAVAWEASYAKQSDYAENPNNYSADYGLVELTLSPGAFKFKLRGELLGSDKGQSLQTPLASLHRFQGSADQFLRTPPDGLRDYSMSASYSFDPIGPLSDISILARHHWFESDTDSRTYGRELDLALKARINKVGFSIEYANYNAETFSNDTQTFFLTSEISF